jgi:Protein of unknown function (DUF3551)
MLRSAPHFAAWCAADPGPMFRGPCSGSRLCGAARRALHRVRDTIASVAQMSEACLSTCQARSPDNRRRSAGRRSRWRAGHVCNRKGDFECAFRLWQFWRLRRFRQRRRLAPRRMTLPIRSACKSTRGGMTDYYFECTYTSLAQCNASASGRAAQCILRRAQNSAAGTARPAASPC